MTKYFSLIKEPFKRLRLYYLRNKLNLSKTVQIVTDIIVSHPKELYVEDYVYIGPGAEINSYGGVKIGSGTIIGPRLRIYSANHNYKNAKSIPYDEIYIKKEVIIGENVWIGGDVIITPGTIINEGVIVGAGTVVSGNIPKFSLIIGNPCKIVSERDAESYEKLKKEGMLYLKIKFAKLR